MPSSTRIEYIDAMRGLAMFMVVVCHMFTICSDTKNPINDIINEQFQLPLFFFISGFFIQHACSKPFLPYIWDRIKRLIIPAIVMMSLFIWYDNADYFSVITSNMKHGYWFTFVLFGFTLIYLLSSKLTGILRIKSRNTFILIIAIGVILISSYVSNHVDSDIMNIFSIPQYQLYIYFALGSICFQYSDRVNKIEGNQLTFGGMLAAFIIFEIFEWKYGLGMLGKGAMIFSSFTIFLGLLIIWKCFQTYRGLWTDNFFGNALSLIGRRSLDVYFLHYFILTQTHFEWSWSQDNSFIPYLIAILLAAAITLASLGIGYIIRLSPVMSELILGVIRPKKISQATKA